MNERVPEVVRVNKEMRVTLPQWACDKLDIKAGDYVWVINHGDSIEIRGLVELAKASSIPPEDKAGAHNRP